MMNSDTTVSVCMITYNHEAFISTAIEGVLMQEADFAIELVIGEDCSTDNTRHICETYVAKHPGKIKLLPSSKNLGTQKNFLRTFAACLDAPYVAFCDGDDKWSDKDKLSIQVEFLQLNPIYTAHAHNVLHRDLRDMTERHFGESIDKPCTVSELVLGWPFHGISLMVKSDLLKLLPITRLPYFISCDRFLNIWIACNGALYYEGTRNMAIYHRHVSGASENSNYAELKDQELSILEFFKPFIADENIYRQARVKAIQSFVYLLAQSNQKRKFSKQLVLALEYIKLTRMAKKSDNYYLLLILFGRPFFVSHRKLLKRNILC